MTFPTLQELAGIVMLALLTTALLVFPSAGQSRGVKNDRVETLLSAFTIDGIETTPLSSDRAR